jgi:hypothetical protein
MIVKNEAHVVRRCLDSVKPFIDTWVIVDTGSTDGTQGVIEAHLEGLPGELHERPWKDFGHNRTEALELARPKAEYTLLMDADEVLLTPPGFAWPELTADAYRICHEVGDSGTSFFLIQLVRSCLPWRYVGVLHEFIECNRPHRTENLEGPVTKGLFDSARNRDPKRKYDQDAQVLEAALRDEPENARYAFYLAQSYRDSGRLDDAIAAYERRIEMGGWAEEVWYSLYQIGVLRERQGGDFAAALQAYLRAFQYRPQRVEPLTCLARYYRQRNEHAKAFVFASAAVQIPIPDDILFLERHAYTWRALDEYCIAAYYVGRVQASLDAADRLLGEGHLPEAERRRVEANRRYSLKALGRR